jgi:hypothetical protein
MEYEFHKGDYVETKDGRVGYIIEVAFSLVAASYSENKRWCSMRIMRRQNDFIISFEGTEDLIPDKFNRIGQYDFTKKAEDKDKDKIELLCEEYTKSFPICDVTNMGYISECYSFDLGVVGKKINELVEAVNSLEEKVSGMAQS